jgi:lysozyme
MAVQTHNHHHAVKHHPHTVTPTYLRGIDVSHWDGRVDWSKVKAAGNTFAFAKATDGKTHVDHTFSTNWAGMKANGLVRGAYHFGHPKHDAVAQAKHFYDVVKPSSGDLQLVLDLEVSDGQRHATIWTWAQAFMAEIQRLSGRPAIFYSYGPFWTGDMGNPKDNKNCPLWLADYRHKAHVPHAWTDWTFWQYTSKGKVAGVHTHVDENYFRGNLAELNQLTFT